MVLMKYLTAPQDRELVEGVLMETIQKTIRDALQSHFQYVNTTYSQVCGIARGYQHGDMEAFQLVTGKTRDQTYVDGLSITRGSSRQHLWTLAVGQSEDIENRQKSVQETTILLTSTMFLTLWVTIFTVNQDSLLPHSATGVTAWSDPLWDGAGCVADTAHSCDRHGWFHREIEPTQDDIEVRWCSNQERSNEDVYTDLLDIWVL